LVASFGFEVVGVFIAFFFFVAASANEYYRLLLKFIFYVF
jgi:hypothetical protein